MRAADGSPLEPALSAQPDEVIRLSAEEPLAKTQIVGQLVLMLAGEPVTLELTVPDEPMTVEGALPILQGLSDLFTDRAVARSEREGRAISCRAGCGACCRQLVPVSASEARRLAHLVEGMEEPTRSRVRRRFSEALCALDEAGLLDRLRDPDEAARPELGVEYLRQGVACPFLEEESCSIRPDRPLACREYLVTSPRENCRDPSALPVAVVSLEADPSQALLRAEADAGWSALVLSLQLAKERPASGVKRRGPDMLRHLLGRLVP